MTERTEESPAETLVDLFEAAQLTLQELATRMNAQDRRAPATHARVSQIVRKGCNNVNTLRALASALGVSRARVYAANDATLDVGGHRSRLARHRLARHVNSI